MLKKFIYILLIGVILSCDNDTESSTSGRTVLTGTTNEDYAGEWFTSYTDEVWGEGLLIYNISDTAFIVDIYLYSLGWPIEIETGTLTKLSETEVEYQATKEYVDNTLVAATSDARIVEYELSEDGSSLLFDEKEFSSTDPR